jgi:hypothetical protein
MAQGVYTAQIDRKRRETPTALDATMKSTDPLGRVLRLMTQYGSGSNTGSSPRGVSDVVSERLATEV